MKGRNIAQISKESLLLVDYLRNKKVGEILEYDLIEKDTGVTMDYKGKNYLRTALHKLKLEYAVIIGKGIKLADSKTTMPLVVNKLTKIDRAVKRAERTHKNLQEKFFEALEPREQQQLLYVGAVFGAIRVASENGKLVYSSKKKISHTVEVPIPQY